MLRIIQNPSIRQDMVFLRRIRQPDHRVLVDIEQKEILRVVEDKGTVLTPCADGDQIYELLTHHRSVCVGSNCHHTPALNGGPLLLSDSALLSSEMRMDGDVLLRHAFEGRNLKGVETFIAYGHAPCGKALVNNIRADQLCGHYLRAKDRVRRHAEDRGTELKAVCLWMHIQWPHEERRTYVFDRAAWEQQHVLDFRMRWRDENYRRRTTDALWAEYWPQVAAA